MLRLNRPLHRLSLMVMFILAACGANADPVLPTPRPTATITPTYITDTPIPTNTRPPVPTPTPQPLPTDSPPMTDTPGPSPTPLIGKTAIRTTPRTPTPTPRVVQSGSLQIEYFTTDAVAVKPGDKIKVYWSVRGTDNAIIYRLKADGSRDYTWSVGRAGSQSVETSKTDKDVSRFVLTVSDDFTRLEQSVTVSLKCTAQDWFFDPGPDGCAAGPAQISQAASQNFERGVMIWVASESKIYVLFNDGRKPGWAVYADEFKDGMPDRDGSLNPPAGLSQPIRGFGLIWRNKDKVKDRLGWAVEGESGFETMIQIDSASPPDNTLYLRGRDGTIYALAGANAAWATISARPATPQPPTQVPSPTRAK